MAYFVDTSALVKLVVAEAETPQLFEWIAETAPMLVASDLARTELLRAVRKSAPEHMTRARAVLDSMTLLTITTQTCEMAAQLDPAILRSLDALHLAAALGLGDDLDALISYDDRLSDAARRHGIPVVAPGK